jgi:holo-[acyl-carrier protein] synthase
VIYGIGTDIVAVERLAAFYARHGEAGLRHILAPAEAAAFRQLSPARQSGFLARRWAAKEALGKALGTGMRPPATFTAISIEHDALGKPCFHFDAALQEIFDTLCLRAHLSLSDEARYALAFVLLESDPPSSLHRAPDGQSIPG